MEKVTSKDLLIPDYIFESSWEVCNKVGGIYTVLSTRANTLKSVFHDRLIFIGPDFGSTNQYFTEDSGLCAGWREHAINVDHLKVRVGRWNIPGQPIVVLVDFTPMFEDKNDIYTQMWNDFRVDSLHAYGDYDESCMFAIAAAKVVESYYKFCLTPQDKVIYHANEWMLGMSVLYLQKHVPAIATVFTTHATSIGRSIAGNGKPLYAYLQAYNGDQMAMELNMQSKYSIEKQAAHYVDCFTTVSEITNTECLELLDKPADVVVENGFEDSLVPRGAELTNKRRNARRTILNVASCLMGQELDDDTLIVATTGRYEFKNKGLDVFIEAMDRLRRDSRLNRNILALITVPAWLDTWRSDLKERLVSGHKYTSPLPLPNITHWVNNMYEDRILGMLNYHGMTNTPDSKVKVMFVPCYLDGHDGIFDTDYYDLLVGMDLTAYASYYEPWGYTPLESIAFHVPTVSTDLAGFGRWVLDQQGDRGIDSGVKVLHRTDDNYFEVADGVANAVLQCASMKPKDVQQMRRRAAAMAARASWSKFIDKYFQAYDFALRHAFERQCNERTAL